VNDTNNVKFKDWNSFKSPRVLTEVALFTALATVLSVIKIWKMPLGGSVTLASMMPLIWLSLRRGPKVGLFAGVVYGFVQMAIDPQIFYPTQILLDYPLAFGIIGLAGFFKNHPIIGTTTAVTSRFIMHLISGAVFFAEYTPDGMNPWVYSTLYNGSYMLAELGISIFFIFLLHKTKLLKAYT
jgi:thiamine transporter